MRVLLVEPQYRRSSKTKETSSESNDGSVSKQLLTASREDETLWYPPLGLMKLARFHKNRGDEVLLVRGCDRSIVTSECLFSPGSRWDRIYITTLFTFNWKSIVETISFYKQAVGGTTGKIFVGGIMSSLMAEDLYEETGVYPVTGVLTSPQQIDLFGDENIDLLPPDYEILNSKLYAINDTYYAYTSRGCVNCCAWCGVPRIEPVYIPYIDIKPMILSLRKELGDKARLKLMDNNVLASRHLLKIVKDLEELGYGRNQYTSTKPRKQRVIDFNQGLDARLLTESSIALLSRLNVKPMRIAFDRAEDENVYVRAVTLAREHGVREFSNYMLYNWKDSPRDLYDRLVVNIRLNEKWRNDGVDNSVAAIYSYPMRFAPIDASGTDHANRHRDQLSSSEIDSTDWFRTAVWTRRFVRSIEIMKGAAHGAISPTPSLAWRTVGESYNTFLANLYMPEELLRNRNKHEKLIHPHEPKRHPGTGKVEEFRIFILGLLQEGGPRFRHFHEAICDNSAEKVRKAMVRCDDKEIQGWLQYYLKK